MTDQAHLVPIAGTDWSVWRWALLRGTGVPYGLLDAVPDVSAAAAADELAVLQRRCDAARREAIRMALSTVGALRELDPERVRKVRKAVRAAGKDSERFSAAALTAILRGALPAEVVTAVATAVDEYEALRAAMSQAEARWPQAYTDAVTTESSALAHATGHPLVEEALSWQNRVAQRRLSRHFERGGDVHSRQMLRARRLALSYLQRYCAKNDTIGFFGPVTWVRVDDATPGFVFRPAPKQIAARTLRWETWAVEEVAESLVRDHVLSDEVVVPRRNPATHLEGRRAAYALGPDVVLDPFAAEVLRAVDGQRTVAQIAATVATGRDQAQVKTVRDVLRQLTGHQLVEVGVPVPLALNVEEVLRRSIDAVKDEEGRERAREHLETVLAAGAVAARERSNPTAFRQALDDLDAVFENATGTGAARHHGEHYAARSLVYEECRRDVELTLGQDFLTEISEPLDSVLISARWLAARILAVVEIVLRREYRRLARTAGDEPVRLIEVWLRAQQLLFEPTGGVFAPIHADFHRRWATILEEARTTDGERVLDPDVAARGVRREFAHVPPGVRPPCYYSPDLMVAAKSGEHIARGDYLAVMGELHMGVNTLLVSCFVGEHPDPQDLARARLADLGEGHVVVTPSREWGITARTAVAVHDESEVELVLARDSVPHRPDRALLLGDFTVSEEDGVLTATHDAGRYTGAVVDLLGDTFAAVVTDAFSIQPRAAHRQRVRIGQLVVSRAAWAIPLEEFDFVESADPHARFLGWRKLAAAWELPRRLYFRVPSEIKPVYLDSESVVGVDLLAHLVKVDRTREAPAQSTEPPVVSFSEMLPDPDGLWFADAEDQRYTGEFRLAVVDRTRPDRARHTPPPRSDRRSAPHAG